MEAMQTLLAKVETLSSLASHTAEECYRMTVTGAGITDRIVTLCLEIEQFCAALNISGPSFKVNGTMLDGADELSDYLHLNNCEWCVLLSKSSIISKLSEEVIFAQGKENLLYFSEAAVLKWVNSIDPFSSANSSVSPSFENETIIWLYKSKICFGGNLIKVIPVGTKDIECPNNLNHNLPLRDDIYNLVKIKSDEIILIRPETFIVSWGDVKSPLAQSFMSLAVKSLISCICCELKKSGNEYFVCFKGTKSFLGALGGKCPDSLEKLQAELIKTVRWIYSERNETRQQLVMDRLSLDMIQNNDFYLELAQNIEVALQQSQDSYAFVILDRKDAYHKEMRELLKDMRSQADMYASKVRDIVGNVTRDTLGVFAFVGYSFLGKFDKANLNELLKSHELSLLVKFLAGYLVLSFLLQLIIHIRDATLTASESKKWLNVLQRYTSREENKESFLEPIKIRRRTLYWALFLMGCIYTALALSTWNLPYIAQTLLTPL